MSDRNAPRIWVLSELYYPEQTSTGYLLTRTAEDLAKHFSVGVITGPGSNFLQRQSLPAFEQRHGVDIHRCAGTNFGKDKLLGRVINMISRSAHIFWKSLRLMRPGDAVLVVTNPPLLPIVTMLACRIRRCMMVLLVHDVYPEAAVASGLIGPNSVWVRLGDWVNGILYRYAARVITLGRDMTALSGRKVGHARTIRMISNWAENEIVWPTPRSENKLLDQLGVIDRFVVLYAGNLGRTHGIEYLAQAAKALCGNSNVHFVVVGFGAKKQWLESFVHEHHLTNVSILLPMPRSEQIDFLNACDVALISFVPGMAGVSVPSRMYSQMAAGKPIIAVADADSEIGLVVAEEQIGWVVVPGRVEDLVDTIRRASGHTTLRDMGVRAARAAATKYSFARAAHDYAALFTELFAGG